MFCHLDAHYWPPLPFQNSLTVDSQGFLFLSLIPYVPYHSFGLSLLSQQYCIFFLHFQLHLLRCIHASWFTYFINVTVCFISISEYFSAIILPELSVLFLDKFFLTNFSLQMFYYISHTPPYSFFMGVLADVLYWSSSLSPISHFSLKCFMSTCCIIYLPSFWCLGWDM